MTTEWSQCTIERLFLTQRSGVTPARHAYVSFATHVPATADEEEIIGIPRKVDPGIAAEPENENRLLGTETVEGPRPLRSGGGPSDVEPGSGTENR
ncbi:hypothetical protein GCM10027176_23020 [Actinoallomurus bryophytorum]